ncbi:MAG TPA: DUF3341 domain-containing protein [Sandaracinaceae bacterium LLY-WYZ-13_1]|nr:DUF3341 domain-containing protein [Sandaracinaceae bacterium LLY-WYZ-13_1]
MRRGLLAEYESQGALVEAAKTLRDAGYRRLDALTPSPSDEVCDALALPRSRLPFVTGAGAAIGGALAYLLLWWTQVVDYPLNVGGRPDHPWPAFVPLTFETAVLFGGVATFVGFFVACGLPRLWHPLFEVDGIERASVDRFVLLVDAEDPRFEATETRARLDETAPRRVASFGEGEGA